MTAEVRLRWMISPLRTVRVLLISAVVLWWRGLVHIRHPLADLATLWTARRAGPLPAAIRFHARWNPSRAALADDLGVLGYGDLDTQSSALAYGLRVTGLGPGDVVGVLARGHRGAMISMIAVAKAGCRMVLMNTGFSGPQLRDVAARERITVLLRDSEFAGVASLLPDSMRQCAIRTDPATDGPTIEDLILANPDASVPLPRSPGGLVLLTSGTTGTPKGAVRKRMSPMISAQLLDRMPIPADGAMLLAAPLFHATGLGLAVLGLALGKTIVFGPRVFDAAETVVLAARFRVDTMVVVPTMLQRMLDLGPAVLDREDTSALRVIACGGSALSPGLEARTAAAFGEVLYNMYGATEVAVAAVATPRELRRAPGTAGRPPVGCRIALYGRDGAPVTGAGARGTIFVASGLRFSGYTDGQDKDRRGDLISTGDIGYFDPDGLLFIDGREDDMIVSGGENVFPGEVEALLKDRPDVADAAVVGVTDSDFGQRLRAYVVPHPGAVLDPGDIRDYVKFRLARFKVPRDVIIVAGIPRNAAGKILRNQLEDAG